ncbi:uncharacterized protein THITE_2107970 [Thermothielavioides terrestris NRRL 8126]|uniref:Uncharacterized protein n=1 Tax=Thermothielavioides terrestris (strain ATCC 38088 / NRRL 8126) TaxID=578455 RepID=G2QWT7_THETT|nr:uncharacterized protein THITE_2107970 [Thermothielavioides terrestris NRRL 8126]AEO63101.1 hypothetical protein THITE_2107970 [Thermothielavioides terrestris NRRL 8126]
MAAVPPEGKSPKPGLNIYTCRAVNPYKLSIAVEELGIPCHYIPMDLTADEHKADWYLAINPNGRVPAIVHVKEDGSKEVIFETAACLLYLAHEFDKEHKISYPHGTPEYWTQVSWLSWQVASYGPMMGQAVHFNRYAVEPVPYGVWRYTSECRRLHHVLNEQLAKHPFITGDRLNIADIAIFIFVASSKWCGLDVDEFPHLAAWRDKLLKRPQFQKGLITPEPFIFTDEYVTKPENQEIYKTIRKLGGQWIKQSSDRWSKGSPVSLPSDFANYA